jgi:type IV pilus assembly protein PilC
MPIYIYQAANIQGETLAGERQANNKDDVIKYLHDEGLMVVKVEEKVSINLNKLSSIQIGDVPLSEKVVLTRQLATMLGAGLPVTQAIEVLIQQQVKYPGMKKKLIAAYKDVQSGLPLSYAFSRANIIYDEMQINLLAAGEKSGNLVEIMTRIAEDMKKNSQLQGKIKGAMIYPIIILITIVIVVTVMMVFMIPAVSQLYKDFGQEELPWITQILVDISNFMTDPVGATVLFFLLAGGIIAYRAFRRSEKGRMLTDEMLLKSPVIGDLVMKTEMLRFSRLFGMLIKSGIPIIDAINSTSMALQTYQFQMALKKAAVEVAKGVPISIPLAKSKVIPIIAVKLIATGEQTGKLDSILAEIESYYEDQVNEITDNLTKLMEPLILLIAGGVVGFLAIAIYLPIYSLADFIA